MPKLYFGSRGGLYYRKNGRKVYVKPHQFHSFGGLFSKSLTPLQKDVLSEGKHNQPFRLLFIGDDVNDDENTFSTMVKGLSDDKIIEKLNGMNEDYNGIDIQETVDNILN